MIADATNVGVVRLAHGNGTGWEVNGRGALEHPVIPPGNRPWAGRVGQDVGEEDNADDRFPRPPSLCLPP